MRFDELPEGYRGFTELPEDLEYRDIQDRPIRIRGMAENGRGQFCRLPVDMLADCTEHVRSLAWHTSGVCARFSTDSPVLAVLWKLHYAPRSGELIVSAKGSMTSCAQNGFELFEETDHGARQISNLLVPVTPEGIPVYQWRYISLPAGMHHYALYFPLYNGVDEVFLGFRENAGVFPGRTPALEKPLVFYGSSITQGACASKVGSCYTNLLARRLDAAIVNLGFCGSACGEENIARYIAGLEMSAFILDYDHNAPSLQHLERTQLEFYRIVREKQPKVPVIMMSMPDFDRIPDAFALRRDAILRNYLTAVESGDRHVYFADGARFFGNTDRDLCTLDGVHPTDIGFLRMADYMEPILRLALSQAE